MAARPGAKPGEQPDTPPEPLQDGDLESPPINPDKKDKKDKKSKKNKGEKRGKGAIIAIVIVVLLLGGIVLVLALNIGGFRENIIMPYLRNAPLVGRFFPAEEGDPLEELTPDEMRAELNRILQQNESQQSQIMQMDQLLTDANFRIQDLVRFYIYWNEFREAQAAFSQMLAHSDPNNFVEFFGYVDEVYVEQLLEEARRLMEIEEETRNLVRTLDNMEEESAGEVLETWMLQNLPLMVRVMRAMSPSMLGPILDTLEPNIRASMLQLVSMPPPTFTPIVPQLRELPPLEAVPVPPPVILIPEPEIDSEYPEYYDDETGEDTEEEADGDIEAEDDVENEEDE
ncbi:MAG: hypothetical protein FWB91_04845 [Defluviitaleaceae bacterium]|nr:hypothetical protein [Defluviitaleaceae bacterium]